MKLFLILLGSFLVGCILPKYWQLFCDWLCSLQQREEQESSEEFYSSWCWSPRQGPKGLDHHLHCLWKAVKSWVFQDWQLYWEVLFHKVWMKVSGKEMKKNLAQSMSTSWRPTGRMMLCPCPLPEKHGSRPFLAVGKGRSTALLVRLLIWRNMWQRRNTTPKLVFWCQLGWKTCCLTCRQGHHLQFQVGQQWPAWRRLKLRMHQKLKDQGHPEFQTLGQQWPAWKRLKLSMHLLDWQALKLEDQGKVLRQKSWMMGKAFWLCPVQLHPAQQWWVWQVGAQQKDLPWMLAKSLLQGQWKRSLDVSKAWEETAGKPAPALDGWRQLLPPKNHTYSTRPAWVTRCNCLSIAKVILTMLMSPGICSIWWLQSLAWTKPWCWKKGTNCLQSEWAGNSLPEQGNEWFCCCNWTGYCL